MRSVIYSSKSVEWLPLLKIELKMFLRLSNVLVDILFSNWFAPFYPFYFNNNISLLNFYIVMAYVKHSLRHEIPRQGDGDCYDDSLATHNQL